MSTHYLEESPLARATGIGYSICSRAVWNGDYCTWIGNWFNRGASPPACGQSALGPDLYGGATGVGLFLSLLYKQTSEELFRKTAEGALNYSLSQIGDIPPTSETGLYLGQPGLSYSLLIAADSLGKQVYLDQAIDLLKRLDVGRSRECQLDLINGIAGAIPVLVMAYHLCGDRILAEKASFFGRRLLEKSIHEKIGLSWRTAPSPQSYSNLNWIGLSHGAAGISWALAELYSIISEQEFMSTALRGIAYEDQYYNPGYGNWPNLQQVSKYLPEYLNDELNYEWTWCNGAPGAAIARLRIYELTGATEILPYAEAALRSTLSKTGGLESEKATTNLSLCHGASGNGDSLLYGAWAMGQDWLSYKCLEIGEAISRLWINHDPDLMARKLDRAFPGLMQGISGIGYYYLRLVDPVGTPCLLLPHYEKKPSQKSPLSIS
jgi:lantibiotic biosynthesis protein